jgi:hypothetical protein
MPNRVDTVVSNADRANIYKIDDVIQVRALFAHIATATEPAHNWEYMVDGDVLRTSRTSIEGETSFTGSVVDTRSAEAGEGPNGFVLGSPISTSAQLAGLPIIIDLAGQMSWSYRITGVGGSGGAPTILIGNEPGFDVQAGLVKQTRFPNWGFQGSASYRVPGTALMQSTDSGAWSLSQTRSAVGSVRRVSATSDL